MTHEGLYAGPIVDAHQHFWDPTRNHHPWLTDAGRIPFRYGDYSRIARPYLPPDYRADATGLPIAETVYVETEWDPTDPIGETRYAASLQAQYGCPNAIVAQAWLDRADAADVLTRQAAFGLVRSVRHKPDGPARPDDVGTRNRTLMLNETWRRGFALLGSHGLAFDLQTAWWNLDEAIDLARSFPDTMIILNHTGLPSDRSAEGLKGWAAAMARFADRPNTCVKISGLGLAGIPWSLDANNWIIRETIAMFGPERAMFASNFPVDSLCGSLQTIYSGFRQAVADLSTSDQRALFCDTARRIYRTEAKAADTALRAAG